MANRFNPNLHDRVIQVAADNLKKTNKFKVYTNPGSSKNTGIGNLYPDIILTPPNSNNVQFIIEVETFDTVNANEAINQWKSYSSLGGTFYLLVPTESRNIAENLCRQYSIKVRFATYSVDGWNNLTINYE